MTETTQKSTGFKFLASLITLYDIGRQMSKVKAVERSQGPNGQKVEVFGGATGLKMTETTHKSIGFMFLTSLITLYGIGRQMSKAKAVEC